MDQLRSGTYSGYWRFRYDQRQGNLMGGYRRDIRVVVTVMDADQRGAHGHLRRDGGDGTAVNDDDVADELRAVVRDAVEAWIADGCAKGLPGRGEEYILPGSVDVI